MKTLTKILVLMAVCCSALVTHQSLGNEEKLVYDVSAEHPIVLKKIKSYNEVKEIQREYVRKNYEDYRIQGINLTKRKDGCFIQTLFIVNDEGERVVIRFDITDACKAYKKSNDKDFRERIEMLKDK